MKKFALLLSLVFVAGVAFAQDKKAEPTKPAETKTEAAKPAAAQTHDVEVVSVDVVQNTLTIKGEKENRTVAVDAKVAAALKTVKAGDKLTVTCQGDEKGTHRLITAIKPAAPAAPAKK